MSSAPVHARSHAVGLFLFAAGTLVGCGGVVEAPSARPEVSWTTWTCAGEPPPNSYRDQVVVVNGDRASVPLVDDWVIRRVSLALDGSVSPGNDSRIVRCGVTSRPEFRIESRDPFVAVERWSYEGTRTPDCPDRSVPPSSCIIERRITFPPFLLVAEGDERARSGG
jgi:hypothetical protein